MQQRFRKLGRECDLHIYPCRRCGYFHITKAAPQWGEYQKKRLTASNASSNVIELVEGRSLPKAPI